MKIPKEMKEQMERLRNHGDQKAIHELSLKINQPFSITTINKAFNAGIADEKLLDIIVLYYKDRKAKYDKLFGNDSITT